MARGVLLATWRDHEHIRPAFRAAVAEVENGADPTDVAKRVGTGERRRTIGALLALVAAGLPKARVEARHAARCLRAWRAVDPSQLTPEQQALLHANAERDAEDVEGWGFDFAVGAVALTGAYRWASDGPGGYQVKPGGPHSRAAIALGLKLAERCLECEEKLDGSRQPSLDPSAENRSVRADYCVAHWSRADRRIEDQIDHLLALAEPEIALLYGTAIRNRRAVPPE
jgi:hypothetical protein